jgi:hypothetical protein
MMDGIMTRKQLAILRVGLLLFVAAGVYPPWTQELQRDDAHLGPTSGAYGWIFVHPGVPPWFKSPKNSPLPAELGSVWWSARIDVPRLAIEWIVIVAVVGVCLIAASKQE